MRKCISPYRHSYFTAVLMRNRPKQSDCAEMYVQRESAQIHADIACAPVSNAGKSSVKLEAVEISSPDFRFRRTSFSPEHTFPYKNHYYVNYYESGEIGSPAISESAHVDVLRGGWFPLGLHRHSTESQKLVEIRLMRPALMHF